MAIISALTARLKGTERKGIARVCERDRVELKENGSRKIMARLARCVSQRLTENYRVTCFSVQLQPPREKVQIQHGAVQAVGPCQRRRLSAVPAFYGRKALSLLPRRLLQGPGETDHASQGLQT